MKRRTFLGRISAAALGVVGSLLGRKLRGQQSFPNIILMLADDLGYGDLSCYGSHINTPNIDRMAQQGVLFQQFYCGNPVCSPSRASLLTGRYPVRTGVPYVLAPDDPGGLSQSETTIAQMLQPVGYKTMCVGKWHLGRPNRYLPTTRGFNEYYGIPYSNDQAPSVLMHNTSVIESPVVLETLTQRYTDQAISFIRRSAGSPFFLYLPYTFPHIPLAASAKYRGKSLMGLYGDTVEELDGSVGQILQELKADQLDQNTLVMFTSDNGPWYQGSPGRLRGRKGDTFEGGVRVPFIAWFPGSIPGGQVVNSFATFLDILPTIADLTNVTLPSNPLDGVDIWPMLTGASLSVQRPVYLYFSGFNIQCARIGKWKLHLTRYNTAPYTPSPSVGYYNLRLINLELYDMDADPEEAEDVSADNPDIVANIQAAVANMLPSLPPEVQAAWNDTQNRPVYPNEPGSWPTPIV